jgi:TetR/AcrR family transcriptional regulator
MINDEMKSVDRHDQQSALTRERLLDAALAEFSARGFEAASTRRIAAKAGCHQPQINYHFASKELLWEATMTRLFVELDAEVGTIENIADPIERFEVMLRRFVRYAAHRPELNRIMVAEAMEPTPRLHWIVDNFSRAANKRMLEAWRAVRAAGGGADVDERLVYHLFIGAASLLWANAPEATLLDPSLDAQNPEIVRAHADALVAFFLPRKSSERKAKERPAARVARRPSR